ncbi:hypothetical protein KDL01_06880 [Actinospica durhamensis]|uniref:Maltokinase N-terminal cap domain-containing protein n=1 Tax=Actinospica durhamensis TaxID=1508375 RepID=A0A941IML0_9ACTN|nr:hypothetical protein [Actinospica durhamensis]MBR7832979.1 hypothetical protein [Actinospica durhamensis]
MALIHHTTVKPSKVELLAGWLPTRPWYRGDAGSLTPTLVKSGGFRLDDPEGEVGIEFMVATDTSSSEPVAYLVPLTYRGAPLDGAEHALIGTMEHGVLGKRWAYDGCQDPVLIAELLSLFEGRAQAVAQSISDTLDHEVIRSYAGAPLTLSGFTPAPTDDRDGTHVPTPHGTILHVHRLLSPAPTGHPPRPEDDAVVGYISRSWNAPDGNDVAAVFMTIRTA